MRENAPDKHDATTVSDATWAVHGGNRIDSDTGAVRTPIVMANSYLLPEDPSGMDWSTADRLVYTRNGALNQTALQDKLAALEGGEATFVDASDPSAVAAAMRENTKLVHVEVIANPTTRVADIAALAQIAHDGGALLSVDSTFTPPPLYRPLADGAALVIHSLTKYINGHGDAMGGAVIGGSELVARVRGAEHYPEEFRTFGHLRLSVGLEDPDDLIADFAQALDSVRG